MSITKRGGRGYVQIDDKDEPQVAATTDKRGKLSSEKVGLLTGHEADEAVPGTKKEDVELTSAGSWSAAKPMSARKKQVKSPPSSKPSSPTGVQPEEAISFAKGKQRLPSYSSLNGEGNGSSREVVSARSSSSQASARLGDTKTGTPNGTPVGSSKEDVLTSSSPAEPDTKSEGTKPETKPPPRPMLPSTVQRGTQLIIVQESKRDERPMSYTMPNLYFRRSLLGALFCCCPLGIIALAKSCMAWSSFQANNIANSKKYAAESKELADRSIFLGVVLYGVIAFTLLLALGIVILLLKTLDYF